MFKNIGGFEGRWRKCWSRSRKCGIFQKNT